MPTHTMNLPIRALYEIKAFSRPMTRVDWRTCKKPEATIIKDLDDKYRKIHEMKIKTKYTNFTQIGKCLMDEINRWTLYGRRKIFKEPRGWLNRVVITQAVPPMNPHPDAYLRRWKFITCAHCYWKEDNGEWFPIAGN
jgi:hypothetical protein